MLDPTDSAMTDAQAPEVYPPPVPESASAVVSAPPWLDGRPRIGIHTSIAGEASRALDTAARIGCTALQIFSGSPRMWPRPHQRAIPAPVAKRFRERRAELRLGPVAVHANYLINLASPDPRQWENSVVAFRDEIIRALQLGADYLIVHPGSARDAGIARGIENVAEAIARATLAVGADPCVRPPSVSLRVLIENTAGQGTGLGSQFAHLQQMLEGCRARGVVPRPGVCLDTAHLLAAGFDIRTPEGLERTLDEADAAFGLDNVRVIHVNDSKVPLAAHIDRHEHIGRGHIGREAFRRIMNHPRLRSPDRAFLLETPIDRPGDDRRNVRALWSLLGLSAPKPGSGVRRGGPPSSARQRSAAFARQGRRRTAAARASAQRSKRAPKARKRAARRITHAISRRIH
ncbi:MAG TPA: deoxyribonuclease IV [Candidatus Acidoferrales bacterium]|nr:deoxyribonuclease IV [Candidatus Acidoferrales bacterium]